MALTFPGEWRFRLPTGLSAVPRGAIHEAYELIVKVGAQTDSWDNLERFKSEFAAAVGTFSTRSSSESWAVTDLFGYMEGAAAHPPIFFEALHSGFTYAKEKLKLAVPDNDLINAICQKHNIPLAIVGDELKFTIEQPLVPIQPPPPNLGESAAQMLDQSIRRSDHLLMSGHGREAVQELLWVLESLVTGFRGLALPTGQVRGKYFNEIVRELRAGSPNTTLERAVDWCERLHGYLSSPTGGSVRHGIDINSGSPLSTDDARFFCNLIRSYVGYFQSEYHKTNSDA